jgi:diaminopimelate decarboxylase
MTSAADLVDRFGSPLYVYDLDRVDAALRQLRAVLPAPSTIYYSLKANPHPYLVEALLSSGCRAEVSSAGELATAVAAGAAGSGCLYTGPGKTPGELAVAMRSGVRRFCVESPTDFARVATAAHMQGVTADCLVRVNIAGTTGGAALRMTGGASQFGIDEEQLSAHPEGFADRSGARLVGAHFFPMSNARSQSSLIDAMTAGLRAAARLRDEVGLPMLAVDLGGGFAAPYAAPGQLPTYPGLQRQLRALLDRYLPGWRGGGVDVSFESGRYLVGTAGRLVCTVVDTKRSRNRQYVVLDSGINHLGGLTGLGRLMPVKLTTVESRSTSPATLVGPLCTPADVLAPSTGVGAAQIGQVVEVPNVGAYGLTASLIGFLSREAPVEVVTRGGEVIHADQLEVRRQAPPDRVTAPHATLADSPATPSS